MKLHRKIAALFGYELIKKRKLNDTLELHLGNLFELLGINCVIDVGANTGQYGKLLRRCGYQGRIASFEPLINVYSDLVEAARRDNNWQTYNTALGRETTVRMINRLAASDLSSFLVPNKFAEDRFKWRVRIEDQQEVNVTTLSSIWPDLVKDIDLPRVFLKIDTQGCDLEVLDGASKILNDVLGIQTEIAMKPIYRNMPDYLTALTEYNSRGFEITGFYPISRCMESLAIIEYDCVMRRKSIPGPGHG